MKKHISELVEGDRFRVSSDVHIAVSDAVMTECSMGKVWNVHVDDEDGADYVWAFMCENEEVEYIPFAQDEEDMKKLIESLMPLQSEGQCSSFPCPRCGRENMREPAVRNAISRYASVYICSDCGMEEALMDFTGKPPLPFAQWGMVRGFSEECSMKEITFKEYVLQECARQWHECQEEVYGPWDIQPPEDRKEYFESMYEHLWPDRHELDGVILEEDEE